MRSRHITRYVNTSQCCRVYLPGAISGKWVLVLHRVPLGWSQGRLTIIIIDIPDCFIDIEWVVSSYNKSHQHVELCCCKRFRTCESVKEIINKPGNRELKWEAMNYIFICVIFIIHMTYVPFQIWIKSSYRYVKSPTNNGDWVKLRSLLQKPLFLTHAVSRKNTTKAP